MTTTKLKSSILIGRRRLLALGLASVALPAFGKDARSETALLDINTFIDAEMQAARIPGMAVGVARDGAIRFVRGYGFADIALHRAVTPDTIFPIASITKTIIATAIMRQVEAGLFKLDEPVGPHLDFPFFNPNHRQTPITFRQLLMHTSSISDEKYYAIDFRQRGHDVTTPLRKHLKDYLAPGGKYYSAQQCFSVDAPGAMYRYSNTGYALLGYLLSRIGGEDGRDQISKQIFEPLAMKHTSWTIRKTPVAMRATPYDLVNTKLEPVETMGFPDWPAGMVRSSVTDIMQFLAASANGGKVGCTSIIGASSLSQMFDMHQLPGLPNWLSGQGLGWMASKLDGAIKLEHWGGSTGVFTAAYIDPATRSAVAILTNASATTESKSALKRIASRLFQDYGDTARD